MGHRAKAVDSVARLLTHPEEKIDSSEFEHLIANPHLHAHNIIAMRRAAQTAPGTRLCIFCMPKSGSTFIQKTLGKTLGINFASLIAATGGKFRSEIGINGKEQELDELAIIESNIVFSSYIAQHHTRAYHYLGTMLSNYGITPIVSIRNIPDSLVSLDDILMTGLDSGIDSELAQNSWFNAGGRLALRYCRMSQQDRLSHLIDTWSKWYVEFLISWKRMRETGLVKPVFVVFENDILNNAQGLISKISSMFKLDAEQQLRLIQCAQSPDKSAIRFNLGIKGRGQRLIRPEDIRRILNMAIPYLDELSDNELELLFGANRDTIANSKSAC
jgi:hypothetical protein